MKGWIDIGSDVSWDEYGGKWAKRAPDGSYYVIDFTNMYEACGEGECKRDGQDQYVCEVKRVDLNDLTWENIKSALKCSGFELSGTKIVNEWRGDEIADRAVDERRFELVFVEACVSYGCAQPLESFSGDTYAGRVRADARRYAEECMRDAEKLEAQLDRPVNRIGSTAREYGRGDLDAALSRGPFTDEKNLMRKLHGLPPEHETTFGTLHPDGTLTDVRQIKQSDMRKCPFTIMMPDHYRADGSCKCDDAAHRAMMIAEWEYSAKDFEGIPLRAE